MALSGLALMLAAGTLASANTAKFCEHALEFQGKALTAESECLYAGRNEPGWPQGVPASWDKACLKRQHEAQLKAYRQFLRINQHQLIKFNPKIRRPDDDELLPPNDLFGFLVDSKICDGRAQGFAPQASLNNAKN